MTLSLWVLSVSGLILFTLGVTVGSVAMLAYIFVQVGLRDKKPAPRVTPRPKVDKDLEELL